MRIFFRVLWIIAFLVATFCWMVVFQHGLSWQGFTKGAREELQSLGTSLSGGSQKKAP